MKKIAAVSMGLISMIFGSARGGQPPAALLGEEDGFVDIGLTIIDTSTSKDGTVSVVARGMLNGAPVGLMVDVLPNWKAQKMDGADAHFYWGRIRYRSAGAESNNFLAALGRLYGVEEGAGTMVQQFEATAVGLNSDPGALKVAPVKMKSFFFEDGPEGRYAEVYTNIDLQAKRLEFHEKDPEYRLPLLRALRDPARR